MHKDQEEAERLAGIGGLCGREEGRSVCVKSQKTRPAAAFCSDKQGAAFSFVCAGRCEELSNVARCAWAFHEDCQRKNAGFAGEYR